MKVKYKGAVPVLVRGIGYFAPDSVVSVKKSAELDNLLKSPNFTIVKEKKTKKEAK